MVYCTAAANVPDLEIVRVSIAAEEEGAERRRRLEDHWRSYVKPGPVVPAYATRLIVVRPEFHARSNPRSIRA